MDLKGLDRVLQALGPYLEELVVCGGWAWYLYRRCLGTPGQIAAQFTRDVDCLGLRRLRVLDRPAAARLRDAGFEWIPMGADRPPAARFAWPDARHPLAEVEFLTTTRGDGARRTEELQQGLVAQALPDIEILTDAPVTLTIDDRSPISQDVAYRGAIRVPNVGHFAIQKTLIASRRTAEQRVKDFFYVFDLVDAPSGLADRLLEDVIRASSSRWQRAAGTFMAYMEKSADQPTLHKGVTEQYPPEIRPAENYVREEVRRWNARLRIQLDMIRG